MREGSLTVFEEVRNQLYYLENIFWDTLPKLYADLEKALSKFYPDYTFHIPPFLRIRSWTGGDRDGHPFVTHEVTRNTLRFLKSEVLKKYIASIEAAVIELSSSLNRVQVSAELKSSIARDEQAYGRNAIELVGLAETSMSPTALNCAISLTGFLKLSPLWMLSTC